MNSNNPKAIALLQICIDHIKELVYWELWAAENINVRLHNNEKITDEEIEWLEKIVRRVG